MGEKILKVCWEDFDKLMEALAEGIKQSPIEPKFIYGISRGGLVPAVVLSHKIGVPITFDASEDFVLFIDDISDEGKSLTHYTSLSKSYTTATLFIKKDTEFVPDFYIEEVDRDTWVLFPWEKEDEPMERTTELNEFED